MRSLAVTLAWVLLAASVQAEEPKEEKGVLVLTEATFDAAIADNEFVLVEFYAPWCGHCQSLEPEYEAAAALLKEKGSGIRLAKVDATAETKLGERFGIEGFPTLKFFKNNGDPMDYNGPRTGAGIVNWLEKKTGPPCAEVSTADELTALLENGVAVVAFLDDVKGDTAKLVESLADADNTNKYVFATGEDLRKKYSAKDGTILLFKNFDEKKNEFKGKLEKEELDAFVKRNSRPNVFEFNEDTQGAVFGSGVEKHLVLLWGKKDADHADRMAVAGEVGKKFKDDVILVHIDTDVEDNKGILEFFGITESQLPIFVAFLMESSKKFQPDNKEITEENMASFVQDFLDDKLKATLKSAELPEDWDSTEVKVLVSSNFNEVAMDKTKDVFVEFYAPWCGHCKSLEPIWAELGDKFKDREDVVIAKMDATANEVDGFEIQGFPTLKLIKKDTNEIVSYQGKRDLESLVKYVETGDFSVGPEDDDSSLDDDYPEEDADGEEPDYDDDELSDEDEPEEVIKDEL